MKKHVHFHGWEARCHDAHYRCSELVRFFGCSARYLRESFLDQLGVNISARIRLLRDQRVSYLVSQGMTLKEIASDLGLKQVSYASALVARVSGMGVRAYRAHEKEFAASRNRDDEGIVKPLTSTCSTHGASNGDDCIFFAGSGQEERFAGRRRSTVDAEHT